MTSNLWCTVCHCWVDECRDTTGGHADFYMTPEQLTRDEAVSAAENKWEDERC